MAREATALQALRELSLPNLKLPSIFAFDAEAKVLGLDFIGASTLYAHRRRRGLDRALLVEVGRSLGSLHHHTRLADAARWPWAAPPEESLIACFVWTRPAFASRLSPDGMRLFGTVQGDAAARDGLVSLAQNPEQRCLIHGDAKELNLLVGRRGPIWLDWELTQLGDPAQDLGSLLADLARCHIAPESRTERLTRAQLRASQSSLLRGYATVAGTPGAALRRRIGLWLGAHLLIYAHAMVLSSGVLDALSAGLLEHAREWLRGSRSI